MAHWAEIDENNIVQRVIVTSNEDNDEGYQWIMDNLGGTWIKTSYNSIAGVHYTTDENGNRVPSGKPHLRYNYAGIGFTYDPVNDAFIPPKPEFLDEEYTPNWVLDTSKYIWVDINLANEE